MPISARLIANKSAYQFHKDEIDALCDNIAGQVRRKAEEKAREAAANANP